jgi:hypothetical protein
MTAAAEKSPSVGYRMWEAVAHRLDRFPRIARAYYFVSAFAVAVPGLVAFAVVWVFLSDEGR